MNGPTQNYSTLTSKQQQSTLTKNASSPKLLQTNTNNLNQDYGSQN